MTKSIFKIIMLLSIFSVVLTSCGKDDDPTNDQKDGNYTVKMDGNTVATGTTIEVGWLETSEITMSATMAKDDFSVLVGAVPKETGQVNTFGSSNSSGTVTIHGKNVLQNDGSEEIYFSISGSVKRESQTKISFEGTCKAMMSTETHAFSGTLESDAFLIEY